MKQIRQARSGGYGLYEFVVFCHTGCMAKSSQTRSSRVFTISFPEPLAKQVIAVAKKENRNISELFREAFRGYAVERRHRLLEAARAEAAQRGPVKYAEDDVEMLVHEVRAEQRARMKKTA